MRRVGIFAGTFDPVHQGHIAFALAAMSVVNLDKVVFLPEAKPRGKGSVTPLKHRLAMLKLAIKPYKRLNIADLEEEQFSVANTLPKLKKIFKGYELYLLLGSDILKNLPKWQNADQLKREVKIIAGQRADNEKPKRQTDETVIYTYFADLSSKSLRSLLKDGETPHGIEQSVLYYIKKHRLYAADGGSASAP